MQPEVTVDGDYIQFSWDLGDARIGCEVESIAREKQDWTAELTWTNLGDDEKPMVMAPKRVNLTSAQACKTLVKSLESTSKLDIPWSGMLEQVCSAVTQYAKRGAPVEKIGGVGTIVPSIFRVEKLLEEHQLTWMYGFGESGKSLLADALALTVQGMAVILGLDSEVGEVLYLDWETDAQTHTNRLRRLAEGAGMYQCPEIHYKCMAVPLIQDARALKRYVRENNIQLVIVDSVEMACGSRQFQESPLLPMVATMRDWGTTVLCIDHISKEDQKSQGDRRTPYGDVRKWNIARAAWEVRAVTEPGAEELRVALYHRKANNGQHFRPMGYTIGFTPEAITFAPSGIDDTPELLAGTSQSERVEGVLRNAGGAMRLEDIAAFAGLPEPTTRTVLWRGVKKGRFQHNRDGSYALKWEEA